MTTEELARARRRNCHLLICAAVCLGMIFALAFLPQPGLLGTAQAADPVNPYEAEITRLQAEVNLLKRENEPPAVHDWTVPQIIIMIVQVVIAGGMLWTAILSYKTANKARMVAKRSLAVTMWAGIVAEAQWGPNELPGTGTTIHNELLRMTLKNPGPGPARLHGLYREEKLVDGLQNIRLFPGTAFDGPFAELAKLLKKDPTKDFVCYFLYTDDLKRHWQQYYRINASRYACVPMDTVRMPSLP